MEHKGEIFELGKLYKFKDFESSKWVVGELRSVDRLGRYMVSSWGLYDMIAEVSTDELGSITSVEKKHE